MPAGNRVVLGKSVPILAVEHVQLAVPRGMENATRAFYQGLLGIPEVPKPPELAKRGGAWFEHGALKIHLGVVTNSAPHGRRTLRFSSPISRR